ncbi:MAG: cytochrome b/b6 domain-containing protein, partial [Sedimenticola sp.]|nr:cytochrome b/b6 domain-containing protein [Sedimenticola sp.]
GEVHFILAITLIALVSLHAVAALKHHFIDRDLTLMRMLGTHRSLDR